MIDLTIKTIKLVTIDNFLNTQKEDKGKEYSVTLTDTNENREFVKFILNQTLPSADKEVITDVRVSS